MQRAPRTFQDGAPPPSTYVGGLGRGAMGFVTSANNSAAVSSSSTYQPAGSVPGGLAEPPRRNVATFGVAPAGYVPGAGRGTGGFGETKPAAGGQPAASLSSYSESQDAPYSRDDEAADAVYAAVEERVRNSKKRPAPHAAKPAAAAPATSPSELFRDCKPSLHQIKLEEWASLPDAHAGGVKHRKIERWVPTTDSVLLAGRASAIDSLSQVRDRVLKVTLDRLAPSNDSEKPEEDALDEDDTVAAAPNPAGLGDTKRARLLLKSALQANPKHGPSWIASARLEEMTGNLAAAKEVLARGRVEAFDDPDVWLESARLEANKDKALSILTQAVTHHLPDRPELWLAAAELEMSSKELTSSGCARAHALGVWYKRPQEEAAAARRDEPSVSEALATRLARRKRILLRGLQIIPSNEALWRAAFEMATEDEEARALLTSGVANETFDTMEAYLTLARVTREPKEAQSVLNEARKRFKGEIRVWLAAAHLTEEAEREGDADETEKRVQRVLGMGVKDVALAHSTSSLDAWMDEAIRSEAMGYARTPRLVIAELRPFLLETDLKRLIAETRSKSPASIVTLRALHRVGTEAYGAEDEDWWLDASDFEGDAPEALAVLESGLRALPSSLFLWLTLAKKSWKLHASPKHGLEVLERALQSPASANESAEELYLAAAKLCTEEREFSRAREFLARARATHEASFRVWSESIALERRASAIVTSLESNLCAEATKKFPTNVKSWLALGTCWMEAQDAARALESYRQGLLVCSAKHAAGLYVETAALEEAKGSHVKARSILDEARDRCGGYDAWVWIASSRFEKRVGSPLVLSLSLLTRGLSVLPKAGSLWAELIAASPRHEQKKRAEEAHAKLEGKDPLAVLATARMWGAHGEVKKAWKWAERAMALDPSFGDARGFLWVLGKREASRREETRAKALKGAEGVKTGEIWMRLVNGIRGEAVNPERVLEECASLLERQQDEMTLQE